MQINGKILTDKLEINPIDVIDKLLKFTKATQLHESGGFFYKTVIPPEETCAFPVKIDITKDEYEYIQALMIVHKHIKNWC